MKDNMNKITRDEFPSIFENISEFIIEDSYYEHRRGSNFYTNSIIEIKDEDEFDGIENIKDFVGFWETNTYISDTEYGSEWSEINTLERVEKKEKVITVLEWIKV